MIYAESRTFLRKFAASNSLVFCNTNGWANTGQTNVNWQEKMNLSSNGFCHPRGLQRENKWKQNDGSYQRAQKR